MSGCRASCLSPTRELVGKIIDQPALTNPVFGTNFTQIINLGPPMLTAVLSRTTRREWYAGNGCEETAVVLAVRHVPQRGRNAKFSNGDLFRHS
jgi:hypothetical protein